MRTTCLHITDYQVTGFASRIIGFHSWKSDKILHSPKKCSHLDIASKVEIHRFSQHSMVHMNCYLNIPILPMAFLTFAEAICAEDREHGHVQTLKSPPPLREGPNFSESDMCKLFSQQSIPVGLVNTFEKV